MRIRLLLIGVLAFVVVGSAGAGHAKQKLVRIVKRHGAITATLTYSSPLDVKRIRLVVRRHGRVVLRHRVSDYGPQNPSLSFRFVAGTRVPAVVVDAYLSSAIVLVSPHVKWLERFWSRGGYRGRRVGGHYYFDATDGRFLCTFTSCANGWSPAQIWAIKHEQLANVTRAVPVLVRANAKRAWGWYLRSRRHRWRARGIGTLAGWCGDEFMLGRGPHCEHVLRQALKAGELKSRTALSGHHFIRTLNRDLKRWGYKR